MYLSVCVSIRACLYDLAAIVQIKCTSRYRGPVDLKCVITMRDRNSEKFVGVIDQGTSSSRFVVFSTNNGNVVARHQLIIDREHPENGWVQQSANDIYDSVRLCLNEAGKTLQSLDIPIDNVVSIGITNQRETVIAWDAKSGEPLCPAIVWSDARTSDMVQKFIEKTENRDKNTFQKKTGLPIHSYFSALKIRWMIDNIPAVNSASNDGRLKVGTVDSWLIYKLTGGNKHLTDVTNASRTNLFNIQTCQWDSELCEFMGINPEILPTVISSAEIYGHVQVPNCLFSGVPLGGILGDQQAALVGQTWETDPNPNRPRPRVKVTYGTGAFLLWDIGSRPSFSQHGLLTTIAYQMGPNAKLHYALEGSIAYASATMDWLRNKLELYREHEVGSQLAYDALIRHHGRIRRQSTTESHRSPVTINRVDACYLVPAFSGLFCPYWREDARGVIVGFDEACSRGDIIAAGYRSSAYQTQEVLQAACEAGCEEAGQSRSHPTVIAVDGGLAKSTFFLESLADITGSVVVRPARAELITALGAGVAATLAVGMDPTGIIGMRKHDPKEEANFIFRPAVCEKTRHLWLQGYHEAVTRSLNWTTDVDKHTRNSLHRQSS